MDKEAEYNLRVGQVESRCRRGWCVENKYERCVCVYKDTSYAVLGQICDEEEGF